MIITDTYTHSSQVSPDSVRPGLMTPQLAQRVAEVLGLEAFQYSRNGEWYAFVDEPDSTDEYDEIHLTHDMAVRMNEFCIQ